MLKNYFKTALRNLVRNSLYTSINVIGLTIGLASCLFIFIYINNELSYDNFHNNAEKVYRIIRTADSENGTRYIGVTSGPFAEAILTDFEGIVEQTLRVENNNGLITYGEKAFLEDKWPGNIRELQHATERAVIMGEDMVLQKDDYILSYLQTATPQTEPINLDEMEKKAIAEAIKKHKGNMSKAAKELGLGRTTLYRKIEKYDL